MNTSAERVSGVLHYVERWLDVSAQFVHAHVARSRYHRVVVSANAPENVDRYPVEPLVSLSWTNRLPGVWSRRARTGALLAVARRHRIGVVHVHFGDRLPDVQGFVRRRRLPWVVSLHGRDVIRMIDEAAVYRPILGRVDAVVVPSEYLSSLAREAGARPEALHVIPAGVDTEWFRPSPVPLDSRDVVFVGRFVEKKGLDVLLDAWAGVRARVPGARLRLLGYGPLESTVRGAGPDVDWVPRPDRCEVRDAIARARVVVSPSRTAADGDRESLLLVNLEAQASGRPVVTTDHGGIPEFVRDGETALVVPEADAGALADALVSVLEDEALAVRLGAAGVEWARRFDIRDCAERVDQLYATLLEAKV